MIELPPAVAVAGRFALNLLMSVLNLIIAAAWALLGASILFALLLIAALHLAWITAHLPAPVLVTAIITVCFVLYVFRQSFRLGYALLEISIGVAVILKTVNRAPDVADVEPPALQTAGGMYIIVRGIDNFAQSQFFKDFRALILRKKTD